MHKYDYVLVGRWRNKEQIAAALDKLRAAGKKVYCFLDKPYDGDGIKFEIGPKADTEAMMQKIESRTDWQTNPTFRQIFETDMRGLRGAAALILVFPAGLSAHMELGVAYGMGKKCYGIGQPEKPETLYLMFDEIFPTAEALLEKLG